MKLTENDFKEVAIKLGCEIATIKAVAEVESAGGGFINNKPKILFEPHVFWKELRKKGISPIQSDICYPTWGTRPYGNAESQWVKLERAKLIDGESAIRSCSWGMFQIMGYNYKLAGCPTIQIFLQANYESEGQQLNLFANYIKNTKLDDELRLKDWKAFARQYNGSQYYKNKYDIKLKNSYERYRTN